MGNLTYVIDEIDAAMSPWLFLQGGKSIEQTPSQF